MPLDHRVVGPHGDRLGVFEFALLVGDVLRDIDQNGTGTPCFGYVEGLLQGYRQVPDILDQKIVLDAGPGNTHRVAFLKSVLTDIARRHLSADDDQRNGVHVCRGDARDCIGHARPRGHQANTDLVGRSGVGIRCVHSGLLMTNQNMLELVLFEKFVVNKKNRAAGIAEYIFDLFLLQAPDYNFCAS